MPTEQTRCYCGHRDLWDRKRDVVFDHGKVRIHSEVACGVFPEGGVPRGLVPTESGRLVLEFAVDRKLNELADAAEAIQGVYGPFSVLFQADRVVYAPTGGPQKVLKSRGGK